jgi:hypothetical protein
MVSEIHAKQSINTGCKGGYGVLGFRQINTRRKVPLQVNFLDADIFIAFCESYLSTVSPIHCTSETNDLMYICILYMLDNHDIHSLALMPAMTICSQWCRSNYVDDGEYTVILVSNCR